MLLCRRLALLGLCPFTRTLCHIMVITRPIHTIQTHTPTHTHTQMCLILSYAFTRTGRISESVRTLLSIKIHDLMFSRCVCVLRDERSYYILPDSLMLQPTPDVCVLNPNRRPTCTRPHSIPLECRRRRRFMREVDDDPHARTYTMGSVGIHSHLNA